MNVQQLIDALLRVEDKTRIVTVCIEGPGHYFPVEELIEEEEPGYCPNMAFDEIGTHDEDGTYIGPKALCLGYF